MLPVLSLAFPAHTHLSYTHCPHTIDLVCCAHQRLLPQVQAHIHQNPKQEWVNAEAEILPKAEQCR